MKNDLRPRLLAIKAEAFALLKPIFAVAIAIGGGIIPLAIYLYDWTPSVQIGIEIGLGAVIVFQGVLLWRLSKYAELYGWHDRKYQLVKCRWKYSLSPDKHYLDGEYEGERILTCLRDTISHVVVAVGPKENLVPFGEVRDYRPALLADSKREHGVMSLREPHRAIGSSLAFNIDFNPPLRKGETAYLHYRFEIPKFKISNIEDIIEKTKEGKLGPRDFEYNSYPITYPIERFQYELKFSSACKIKPKGIEVTRGTATFQEEQDIMNTGAFHCEHEDGEWRLSIDRDNPPMKSNYKIMWTPPHLHELS